MITQTILILIGKKIIVITSIRFQYNQMDASAMIKLEGERAEGMQCAGYK